MGWVDYSRMAGGAVGMVAPFIRRSNNPAVNLAVSSANLFASAGNLKAATLYGVAYKINHSGQFLSKELNAKSAMGAVDKIRSSIPNSTDHRAFKIPERAAEFEDYVQNNGAGNKLYTEMDIYSNIVEYTKYFDDAKETTSAPVETQKKTPTKEESRSSTKASTGDFLTNNSGAITTGIGAVGGMFLSRHLAKKKAYNDAIRSGASIAQAQAARDQAGGFGTMMLGAGAGAAVGNIGHTAVKAYRTVSKSDDWNKLDEDGKKPGFFNRAGQVFHGIGDQYKNMYDDGGGGIRGVANTMIGQTMFKPSTTEKESSNTTQSTPPQPRSV